MPATTIKIILLLIVAVFVATSYPWTVPVVLVLAGFAWRLWAFRIMHWLLVVCLAASIAIQWSQISEFKRTGAFAYFQATMTIRAFLPDDTEGFEWHFRGREKSTYWTLGQIRKKQPAYYSETHQKELPIDPEFKVSFDRLVAKSMVGALWGLGLWVFLVVFGSLLVSNSRKWRTRLTESPLPRSISEPKEQSRDWQTPSVLHRVTARFVKYPALIVVGLLILDLLNTAIFDFPKFQSHPIHYLGRFVKFTGLGMVVFVGIPLCLSLPLLYRREWRRTWEACFKGKGVASPWELNTLSGSWFERRSTYRIAGIRWRKAGERLHTTITGGAEVGRTAAIEDLLGQMRSFRNRRHRAIVDDRDGHYLSRFHRKGRDFILNPAHGMGSNWDFFSDAAAPADFDRFAEILIPELMNNKDQCVVEESRMFFSGLARAMWKPDGPAPDLLGFMRNLLETDAGDLSGIFSEAGENAPIALDDKVTLPMLRAALTVHCRYLPLPAPDRVGPASKPLSFRSWLACRDKGGFVFLTGHHDKDPEKNMSARIVAGIEQFALEILSASKSRPGKRVWLVIEDVDAHHPMRVARLRDGLDQSGACIILGRSHGVKRELTNRTEAEWGLKAYGTHLSLPPSEQQKVEWKQHCLGKTSGTTSLSSEDIANLPPFDGLLRMPVDGRYAPVVIKRKNRKTVATPFVGNGS